MKRYNPNQIEPLWQKQWAKSKLYQAVDFSKKPKFVMLSEFPYPSGDGLHMGHTREYTIADIIARHRRMSGFNVLFPMGYDAFGLPTENFAIKNKVTPQLASQKNIQNFQDQFDRLGFSIDWDRSFETIDPKYYKWTQWLFLQFFKAGLAVKEETLINWCPFCKTGLSNEEVINGRHERCDTLVTKKVLNQWVLKITEYADRLIDGLNGLDYPNRISSQQINWIGKSIGAEVNFKLADNSEVIKIFTTAHDTIFGATFMVIAPEHPLLKKITKKEHLAQVESYLKMAEGKTDIERQDESKPKTGVFTGAYAINPVNNKRLPVWISDYVLMGYGTGAIMAVPGQDERDYQFAKKHDLEIIYLTRDQEFVEYSKVVKKQPAKYKLINSEQFSGLSFLEARDQILDYLIKIKAGTKKTEYRLRDWIFSRQRYWGEPIPIIYCPEHGAVPVPDQELPLELPSLTNYLPSEDGQSPLSRDHDWVNTICPICHKPAQRETDTMPNWAGSSWYYLRYYDPHNDQQFADPDKLAYWGMVDLYLGGMEHTTLHLLYSRFWNNFLYDQGLVPFKEPYQARRGQGIVLAADGTKMSKSKGNIINPMEIIKEGYGADSLHVAIAFLAPYDLTTPWSPESVVGSYRFLDRVYRLVLELNTFKDAPKANTVDLLRAMHSAIKKVSEDISSMNFNTAIASLMEYTNFLYKYKEENDLNKINMREAIETLLLLLAPFAPHLSEELWHEIANSESVHLAAWPTFNEKYLIHETKTIILQVNGKLRSKIEVQQSLNEDAILKLVDQDDRIQEYLKDKNILKKIYIQDKLINFVVK